MRPMLAERALYSDIRYPVLASPKLDGVRCLIMNGVAVSRRLKPLPNALVQHLFGRNELNGLDGELIAGDPLAPDVFNCTTSMVMSRRSTGPVYFHVFDRFDMIASFKDRLLCARASCHGATKCVPVVHRIIKNEVALRALEESFLSLGYEGIMLRDPAGPYKFGRSTVREGWLLKLKRVDDSEAVIVSVYEQMHNMNTVQLDALGYKKRALRKEGLVPAGTLGGMVVRDMASGIEFHIGAKFTQAQRDKLWALRRSLPGKIVKYRFQPAGVKEKPRFPRFLGFRDPRDM